MRFSGAVLTIMLRNGSRLSGRINGATELECTASERTTIVHDGAQSANHGPGDVRDANENEAAEPPENEAQEPPENQAAEPQQNEAAERQENELERSCSTMRLRSGTAIREAVLRVSSSGRAWKKIELEL